RFMAEEDGTVVAIVAAQVRPLLGGRSFWYVPRGPVMDYTHPSAAERLRELALALSISSLLEVAALLWALRRRIESIEDGEVARSAARSAVAAGAAALLMLGGLTLVQATLPAMLDHGLGRLVAVGALTSAGGAIYLVVASALRAPEIGQLRALLARRRGGAAA
ncbi:MAG TPA: hypothetical protein VHK28_04750, partial [Candidatus Limnocylindria bacterium]|nr:hypothetical protein [Candidatus Limnocylindria bacterium]